MATGQPVRWGLGDVGLGLFAVLAGYVLIGAPLLAATGYSDTTDVPLWLWAVFGMLPWIGFLGAPILAARLKGNGVVADFGLAQRWTDVPLGLAIGFVTQLGVAFLLYWPLEQLFDGFDAGSEARETVDPIQGLGVVVLVAIVVFGAPFAEELFWRGLVYRSLENRWGSLVAVAGSAVAFGALHLQPVQFAGSQSSASSQRSWCGPPIGSARRSGRTSVSTRQRSRTCSPVGDPTRLPARATIGRRHGPLISQLRLRARPPHVRRRSRVRGFRVRAAGPAAHLE